MEPYERSVSLRTIYVTLLRRFEVILAIFVPVALISFFITNFALPKQYTSSVSLNNNSIISSAQHQQMQAQVKNTEVAASVAVTIKNAGVAHSNGSEITANEIYNGISFDALASNSITVTAKFSSPDGAITKYVLDTVIGATLENMKATISGALTASEASNPVKTSKENRYFLIALAVGFVVACGVPFVWEIAADQVYDKKDIELMGGEALDLAASMK